jgi:DNA-binding SARP family transcriptional activator/tRNA A-37 threonylcarbamoyl transferase component Bud32
VSDEATELATELATTLADRFDLLRVIGRGGSAVVFLATDLKHDRAVALKVLRPQLDSTVSHDRFLAEIRTTARLNHPHILPLFDSGEADERVFFTMPFVEGESLRERLRRETRLSIDEALRITREVASALEYAHARRVVHRDIKPENILLSTSGHAFVSDFGVAYALDEARSVARTDPGFAVGTLAYMSPEEMEGERELDGRADLYSLACVLYEMLVGSPPFHAGPSLKARDVIPSVLTSRAEVPAAVDRALRHALAKAPEQRYATMAEFTAALHHASRFEISTLGGLTIRADGRPLRGDHLPPHALACLALLAHAGARGVPRERLEALLWEGHAASESSSRLEHTLAAIRSELGPADVLVGERVIHLEPSLVDSDVDRFETMVRAERLADAVAEYHGPFLHGFSLTQAPAFAKWVEHTAAALAFDYAIALEHLARDAEARGDYADAGRWWHKLVGQDPLNGRLTVGLMKALAAAGDRSGAIEQASLYEVLIEEELELPPDRGVVAFAERLRAGWDPRDAEADAWLADTSGSPRMAPFATMRADSDGTPDTTWGAAAAGPASSVSPVSGSRDQVWRRVGLVLAAVTVLLAALWLLGARPADPSAPRETPAPNGTTAPGHRTGATQPPSGIGAR